MKIEIGEYTLIAGGGESPEDEEVNAQEVVQIAESLRGSSAQVFNRGNLTRTHTFRVTRQYESFGAAEQALFAHPDEIPRTGDITITVEPCDETANQVVLSNATVHAFAAQHIGRTIIWRYTITSGAAEIVEPEPDE